VFHNGAERDEDLVYVDGGRLVLSPSDLVGYLLCRHLSELSLAVADGNLTRPEGDDPELSVVQARGIEHEKTYLASLEARGLTVARIPGEGEPRARAVLSEEALAEGVNVIYQAAFVDDDGSGPVWIGYADFLTKIAGSSRFGAFSYEPEDTKLARRVHPSAVLQLCEYAEQLERLQGVAPRQIHVVLGGQDRVSLRLADFAAYFRAAKARFATDCATGISSYPIPVAHCAVCPWQSRCENRWSADDHLSLVSGLRTDQVEKLQDSAGITTVTGLANYSDATVKGLSSATLSKLRHQAQLQVKAREHPDQPPPFDLLEGRGIGIGLAALPEPSPGDLFFDIEGDPFVGESGLEYLLGVGWIDSGGQFEFKAFWGVDAAGERAAFENSIDFVSARQAVHPDLHIYHYASYERTALGKLMGRYGTREAEVDALFRGNVLIDLYRVVTQSLRVGTPSYSLKTLEALYMEKRTQAITDAGSSVVQFEEWLQTEDQTILDAIEDYNRVDCLSTQLLRDWLEVRRQEYASRFGGLPSRPTPASGIPAESLNAEISENDDLKQALGEIGREGSPPGDPDSAARLLLADLLDWHRREDKPAWWEYFHRIYDCVEEDLYEDTEAISGLEYLGESRREKKSTVHQYRFDSAQEFKLKAGDTVADPDSIRERVEGEPQFPGPGTLVSVDSDVDILELKRSTSSLAPHPRSIIPGGPIPTPSQRAALRRIATSVIDRGIDGDGPYRAVRDLLLRCPPRTQPICTEDSLVLDGEDADHAVVRVGSLLNAGYLAVQGPPGSGKTRAAAALALGLIRKGKKVGITANSHAVITNLLDEIGRKADKARVAFRASQKGEKDQVSHHQSVVQRDTNVQMDMDVACGVDIVAGTAWMFARAEFDQRLDFLIVDEAGQFSLANTVAIGGAARNLVLVGDPMQLAQPSKGTHPDGTAVSALDHILGSAQTLPDNLGIFLDRTHRLHPKICEFISEVIYEDRLRSVPDLERQRIGGYDALGGSGLRWRPICHEGNRTASPEEALEVASCIAQLLGRTFTDRHGAERPVNLEHILVVAPYNAQVRLLKEKLPSGAVVGTVDRFQGQQAPIVICSMTTSSIDEIPRGMEFLLSRNRLNVAVSRSQALTIMVASPKLLAVRCRSVEQVRLANGLCRYVEMAG
jgi:predicted RecB family nuclease